MRHESTPLNFPQQFVELNRIVYDRLRQGFHFSSAQEEFLRLQQYRKEFESFYNALGLDIRYTPDAIYLEAGGSQRLTQDRVQQMSMFFIVLAPYVEETENRTLHDLIRSQTTLRKSELPHLAQPAHKTLMGKVGVSDIDSFNRLLKNMRDKGFVELSGNEIRLLGPSMRFVRAISSAIDSSGEEE